MTYQPCYAFQWSCGTRRRRKFIFTTHFCFSDTIKDEGKGWWRKRSRSMKKMKEQDWWRSGDLEKKDGLEKNDGFWGFKNPKILPLSLNSLLTCQFDFLIHFFVFYFIFYYLKSTWPLTYLIWTPHGHWPSQNRRGPLSCKRGWSWGAGKLFF